jgi:hypothetical protein
VSEKELLVVLLDRQRDHVLDTAEGLGDDDLRRPVFFPDKVV